MATCTAPTLPTRRHGSCAALQLLSSHSISSKTAKLTFVASAFAKTSLCTALAVQALSEILVGPQTALFVAVALAVGGQDGLVQGCLGKVITLRYIILIKLRKFILWSRTGFLPEMRIVSNLLMKAFNSTFTDIY